VRLFFAKLRMNKLLRFPMVCGMLPVNKFRSINSTEARKVSNLQWNSSSEFVLFEPQLFDLRGKVTNSTWQASSHTVAIQE